MKPSHTASSIPAYFRVLVRALFYATAACCAATSFAADAAQPGDHPLAGSWSWTLFDGKCTETLQYRPAHAATPGTVLGTSAEAVVEWSYEVTPHASEKGFYKLVEQAVRVNGKKDCYGDLPEQDSIHTRYLQFSPAKHRMIVCRSESLQACFGPLQRLP